MTRPAVDFSPCSRDVRGATRTVLRRGPWLTLGPPRGYEVDHLRLPVRGLEGERVLIHATDLHLRPGWDRSLDVLLATLGELPAGPLAFTGDWVEDKRDARPALPTLRRLLGELTRRRRVVSILGNHDAALPNQALTDAGADVIEGRALDVGGIEFVGLHGRKRRELSPHLWARLPPKRAGVPRVALVHYPDAAPIVGPATGADVVLAGHTHGGQVCLPGRVAIIKHDRLPRACCAGLSRVGDAWLHVSRGLGFSSWRVRAFCPASLSVIELTHEETQG